MKDVVSDEFVCQFETLFSGLKSKRIVLYGIGYRTGALVDALSGEFNFIGLMDKEKSNIGKIKFGLKILDEKTVIADADCIIIVSVSFYDVIFNRISHLSSEYGIDIYFPNGIKAEKASNVYNTFPSDYSALSIGQVKKIMQQYDVISFDLFDTLLMRKVMDPDTIFEVMDYQLKEEQIKFSKVRKQAYADVAFNRIPDLESIYLQFQKLSGLSGSKIEKIKKLEIETEKRFLTPRNDIIKLYNYAKELGKDVYIISDMYLSSDLLCSIFNEYNIPIEKEKLIVSCECQMDKSSGSLWNWIRKTIKKDKMMLHIGDNAQDDCFNAEKYGISALHLLSAKDMMRYTIFNKFIQQDLSTWSKVSLGLIAERLFNSPFTNDRIDHMGRVLLKDEYEIGYVGYACLIESYLIFIMQHAKKINIHKLLFCARDGYLLQTDFKKLQEFGYGQDIESKYLKISRLLIRKVSLFDDNHIDDFAVLPYSGPAKDYYRNRFGIDINCNKTINMPEDWESVHKQIEPYRETIKQTAKELRENYIAYLNREIGEFADAALVDFGYSGSSQYYLSQILNKPLIGFYLLADMDEKNMYNNGQKKVSYIYDPNDLRGIYSQVSKSFLLLESIFTAPYGTYLSCNKEGEFKTGEKMMNNLLFDIKKRINDGIIEFFHDMNDALDCQVLDLDMRNGIGSELLTTIFSDDVNIDKELLDSFGIDDELNYRKDCKVFE